MFYFRDELLHVLRGVIPLEGALLRKPKPIQRSAGSAELRYCLVLYVAAKASESCRHKQYEFCWNSAEEQVCCTPLRRPVCIIMSHHNGWTHRLAFAFALSLRGLCPRLRCQAAHYHQYLAILRTWPVI